MTKAPQVSATTVKVHACTVEGCNKTFSRKSNLKAHMRLHTGEQPYTCLECGKKFKWKSCMASHERVHTRRTNISDTADAFVRQLQLQQMHQEQLDEARHADVHREEIFRPAESEAFRMQQFRVADEQKREHMTQLERQGALQQVQDARVIEEQRMIQAHRLEQARRVQEQQRMKSQRQRMEDEERRRMTEQHRLQQVQQQRLEQQRQEQQRMELGRLKQQRMEQQRIEQQRIEQQRIEQQRMEQQRMEQQQQIQQRQRLEEQHRMAEQTMRQQQYRPPARPPRVPPPDTADNMFLSEEPQLSSDHQDQPAPSKTHALRLQEQLEMATEGQRLSLLNYYNASAVPIGRSHSTEMTEMPVSQQLPDELMQDIDEVDDDDDDDVAEFGSQDAAGLLKDDPSQSNGSNKDFSVAIGIGLSKLGSGILKLQAEEVDLMPYYGKRSRTKSTSERKPLIDWAQNEGGELGQPYYLRDSSEALNRLSGSLKYNGRWSSTMSDILGTDPSVSTSNGIISLMIPEFGITRGSYNNSISPLGITITTPSPSPRTAIAYTHRGFMSPHQST